MVAAMFSKSRRSSHMQFVQCCSRAVACSLFVLLASGELACGGAGHDEAQFGTTLNDVLPVHILRLSLPTGLSLISNPFETLNNRIGDIRPSTSTEVEINRLVSGLWVSNTFDPLTNEWTRPEDSLRPGDG